MVAPAPPTSPRPGPESASARSTRGRIHEPEQKRSTPLSYARNLLSRGEEVVFESRQHWFAVIGETWPFVIATILAFAVLIWATTSVSNQLLSVLQIIALVALIVSLARIGLKVWSWRNQEYLVTTRRLIKAEGIFNKEMADSSLEKINDAHLTQSWIGRIFDYGTLDILTAAA